MADRVIEIIVDVADKASGALGGIQKTLLAMDAAVQRMQNRIRALGLQKFAAAIRLIDRVSEPGSRINALLKKLAGKAYTISMRLNESVGGKIRQLEAQVMKLCGHAWTIGINLRDGVTSKLKGITDGALMGAGLMGAGMLGTAGIGYGVVNGVQSYMDFEKQMTRVQAVKQLSKDSDEMHALTEQAKALGATTAWTRSEVAQAMYYQAMAGWDVDKIRAATPSILNLASAGGTDLATTSDIVTDSMTGFQLRSGEQYIDSQGRAVEATEHYADVMAKLVTSSNTNISQLGEALKYSAPAIGAMYADKDIQTRMHAYEDASVMLGLMANAGIKGSMAGTATRAIFSRFGAENRNAYQALRAMNVDFTDEGGNVRRISDVMGDLRSRFREGVDPNQLLEFAEAISGEKIHADTRRKLNSFIENTQKNGGKITGADMLKMSSMLAGQEAMSGLLAVMLGDADALTEKIQNAHGAAGDMAETMLDNLDGDIKILGSAWDAFQQGFFEGKAGEGLRSFVQTLTEVISRAQKLFSDGIQIGDIGKIIGDVINRLKNKFLEFDGIGSVLAGGALMAGLLKISATIQRTIAYFRQLKALEMGQRIGGAAPPTTGGRPPTGLSGTQSVGTMHVTAGVVNVNGKVAGGAGGGKGAGNTSIIDRYNREKERIRGTGTPPPPPAPSIFSTMRSGAMTGGAFAALFGALDVFSTKSMSAERMADAKQQLVVAQKEYDEMRAQGATQDQLTEYTKRITDAQAFQRQVAMENQRAEMQSLGGATGSVMGAVLGGAIGSLAGPMGTVIGSMIGGIIGEKLGVLAGNEGADRAQNKDKPTGFFRFDEPQETPWEELKLGSNARRRALDAEEIARRPFENLSGLDSARRRTADAEADAEERRVKAQNRRFDIIDEDLKPFGVNLFHNKNNGAESFDYYRQQREAMAKTPEQFNKANDASENLASGLQKLGAFFDEMFFNKAAAAELTPEQQLQQAAMERGEIPTAGETSTAGELKSDAGELDTSTLSESLTAQLEALGAGVTEFFSGLGESISEGIQSALDGASEIFSTFGETVFEGLTSTFDGVGEIFGSLGATISEGLASTIEGASEIFSGLGETITAGMDAALSSATGALEGIQSAFTSTKDAIQSAWAELPGFFSGIFAGLGDVAASAGAAILSGLTSVCGAVISAWQSVASTVSSIIASISAAASSVAGMIPSIGGGTGKAEGGFVAAETHFFAGEHGPEVVIPLSTSRRARAMDLFEKTAAILGGDALNFGGDELQQTMPELSDDIGLPSNDFEGLDADSPITNKTQNSNSTEISMGGINVSFDINGAENPQEFIQTVTENINELVDKIAATLSEKLGDAHENQNLEAV